MPWFFYDSNGNYLSQARGTQAVTDGGTGVASMTDGGVLLGSGAGAITSMAVLADGELIVGDGTIRCLPCHLSELGGMDGFFIARLICD